jgi:CxxC-x17-CxxC domain-containing protein
VHRENDTEIDTDNQVILTTCLICGETTAIPAKPNYNKNVVCDKCKKAIMKLRRFMECDSDDKGNCLCR